MEQLLADLEEWGADGKGAMKRLYADGPYYAALVGAFADDLRFRALEIAMGAKDYSEAYTLAHGLMNDALKLGLTPLFEPLSLFADRLRTRSFKDAPHFYEAVLPPRENLRKMVRRSRNSV